MDLILASDSPRRRELLARLTGCFRVVPSAAEETTAGTPQDRAVAAARAKVFAALRTQRGVIIGADTIVAVEDEVLGKPRSRADAAAMLRRLSGREHRVYTGICVHNSETGDERTHCEETRVTLRALDDEEIESYLDTGEYRDKAGAYAIQGAAARFIPGIDGDYTNVMGLPLCRLTLLLREVGVRL